MRVVCPHCQAQFRITVEILAAANGKVRCGRCKQVFDAAEQLGRKKKIPEETIRIRSLFDEEEKTEASDTRQAEPEKTQAEETARMEATATPGTQGGDNWFGDIGQNKKEEDFNWFEKATWTAEQGQAQTAEEPASKPAQAEQAQPPAEDTTPVFREPEKTVETGETGEIIEKNEEHIPLVLVDDLHEQANPVKRHTFAWFMGALLMASMLCLQYAWFNRDELSQKILLRPYLEIMCEYAGCELPLMNDLGRGVHSIQIINSQVEPNPKEGNRLLARISIVNTAKYPQPFPFIELRLTSFDEKIIAMRKFKPEEYLSKTINMKKGIQAAEPLDIILDIVKPSATVSGYHFELL